MLENITNLALAGISTAYAVTNRGTLKSELKPGIRTYLKSRFPKFGKIYDKISPTIEHFVYGFAMTSFAYGILTTKTYPQFSNFAGSIYGASIIGIDYLHEKSQAKERGKFQPAQFLGTCAGVLTGIAVNNLEGILK